MTFSRRTILTAALLAPTFALADGSRGGKVNVPDISITVYAEGDGAPEPFRVKMSSGGLDRLTENLNAKDLEDHIVRDVARALKVEKIEPIKGESMGRAVRDGQLVEGEYEIQMLSGGPKFKITIKIVIKF